MEGVRITINLSVVSGMLLLLLLLCLLAIAYYQGKANGKAEGFKNGVKRGRCERNAEWEGLIADAEREGFSMRGLKAYRLGIRSPIRNYGPIDRNQQ